MSNLDSVSVDTTLKAAHQISGECSHDPLPVLTVRPVPTEEAAKLHSQDEQFRGHIKELSALAVKATEQMDTSVALAQVGGSDEVVSWP